MSILKTKVTKINKTIAREYNLNTQSSPIKIVDILSRLSTFFVFSDGINNRVYKKNLNNIKTIKLG